MAKPHEPQTYTLIDVHAERLPVYYGMVRDLARDAGLVDVIGLVVEINANTPNRYTVTAHCGCSECWGLTNG